jgi:CheY-like chemotaxis protein
VFLDIGMPRMDGYETARRLRAILGNQVVLVALTGWGQDDDKRRSQEAGFDQHLTKPPDPDRLERLISACGNHD